MIFTVCSPSEATIKIKMVGKLFLLAVVCAALVQGDDVLQNAINRGLRRAEGINRNGERRIDAAINEVGYKRKLIQTKTSAFIQKSERQQEGFEEALALVCEKTREKARETNRPQNVFECIDRVQENGVKSVDSYIKKFQTDMERLEKTKLQNIETYAKPLDTMQDALQVRYQKAVSIIQECQNANCITIAINSFLNWIDLLFAEIERIRTQINSAITNFQRDATTYLNNTSRQVTRLRAASARNAALCLRNREFLFGEQ